MPGNVTVIGTVSSDHDYPFTRFASFTVHHTRETAITMYADGSSQTQNKADSLKRRWQFSHRLSSESAATLRTFWKEHINSPINLTDATNGVTYKAVFVGNWSEERRVGDLYLITLEAIEIQ